MLRQSSCAALKSAGMRTFGDELRLKRERAGLSQMKLAVKVGVDERTIRNLEADRVKPSPDTLTRLRGVAELALEEPATACDELVPNAWFAPHVDALRLHNDMHEALNGHGGMIEQTYLYLDGKSASDFIKLSTSAPYATAFREAMPLAQVATRVLEHGRDRGLDVHAVGAGDGRSEVRLVQHLCDGRGQPPDVRLCLLDISPVMLHTAFRHAADLLEPRGVAVFALSGDFNELRRIPVMSYRPAASKRLRLYSMLGCTTQNLENEVSWLRDLASCTAPGDLLVLDLRMAQAPAGDAAAIRAAEPTLREGPRSTHFEWLSGPIWRHCRGVTNVNFRMDLLPQGQVPGSYELDVVAEVEMKEGPRRDFVMLRLRSYDPEQLATFVRPLGWELELSAPYGIGGASSTVLMLLRRR